MSSYGTPFTKHFLHAMEGASDIPQEFVQWITGIIADVSGRRGFAFESDL